jgi:carboxypeptidase Q
MRNITILLLLCASSVFADDNLALRLRNSTTLIPDTRELTDQIGGRVTGSPACERAERWAADKLRAAGVDSVKLESYPLPGYWIDRGASASAIAPETFPLRIAAAPMTAPTPADGVEGELVDFGDGSPEALAKVPHAAGKIAFVHTPIMKSLDDLFGDYMRINPLLETAKKSGVAAMLIESSQARSLLYRHPMSLDGSTVALPVAIVAHDNAERVVRLMETGPVRVRMKLSSETKKGLTAHNVVGEIRGSEVPDEIVIFGAHLDSWDLGTGALDNGVNSAAVIDIARAIKASGVRPRRTMRFILFTGEEQGMIGSRAYVRDHMSEMPKVALMMTADIGSGKTVGYFLNGREDLRKGAESGGLKENPLDALDGTDNFDFILAGVPNMVVSQDPSPYFGEYHAESDTFDKVDQTQARENAAAEAHVLWYFANAAEKLPRQTRAEVEKLLVDRQLVDQMKAFAQWDGWENGTRWK